MLLYIIFNYIHILYTIINIYIYMYVYMYVYMYICMYTCFFYTPSGNPTWQLDIPELAMEPFRESHGGSAIPVLPVLRV